MSTLELTIAPGDGLLGRRGAAVLFVPAPDDRVKLLLDAFHKGSVEQTWSRLAQSLVDHDLDQCGFAFIDASHHLDLRVFGSVEIRTDLPSVPMLSGSGSLTWIEHRVVGDRSHPVELRVGSSDIDDRTSLAGGVVHAAGFVATATLGSIDLVDTGDQRSTRTGQVGDGAGTPSETSTLLDYLLVRDDLVEHELEPLDGGSTVDLSEGLEVPARACPAGHANAPARSRCAVCDQELPTGDDSIEQLLRPSLGTLVFDDGSHVELRGDVVIGRDPQRSGDGWRHKTIDGDRVSRTHLAVRCSDWQVLVEDCGSRNGTVVVPDDGAQPVALVSGTPLQIDPGARIYFGSASAEFVARTS